MDDFTEADQLINNIKHIAQKYQEVLAYMIEHRPQVSLPSLSSEKMQEIAIKAIDRIFTSPEKFMNINAEYGTKFTELVTNTVARFSGEQFKPIYSPDERDRRFKDSAWRENLYFDFIKQFYLMSSEWMQKHTAELALEPRAQQSMEFYTKQFIDALCPSNFPFYNPEVVRESLSTKWQNIAQGLDNFLEDLRGADGVLNIKTTDKMSFKLGQNIASTKGKIVMQNDLMQLICYEPKKKIHAVPILIVPPWINKYYILDLSKDNSYVKWIVDQGFQVFLISWVNPDAALAHKNFEDYAKEGIIASTKYICDELKFKKLNAVGYCIGGTLLAITLAYMKAHKINHIASATYITALLDFKQPGEVGMFINEDTISSIEAEMDRKGYFDGRYLANSFSVLRANDLIWSFFVNNYLLGRRPLPFDLLYWNSDPTNLPASMHSFYLRNMYLENKLTKDGITILDRKIDVRSVDVPSFFLGAKDDHIAPWRSVYSSMQLLGGDKVFCLSASGHVAGVVNPPHQKKYSYWSCPGESNEDLAISGDPRIQHEGNKHQITPDEWMSLARETIGSWWEEWAKWLRQHSGEMVDEKHYQGLKEIEPAPGGYVKVVL